MEGLWTSKVTISNGNTRVLTPKIDFSDRHFIIADAAIESIKFLHTLFYKYLDQILEKFEQNSMV